MPILGLIVGLLGRILVAYTAVKLFFIGLVVLVLPVVLNNLLYALLEKSMTLINQYTPTGQENLVFELTGIAAYLSAQLGLVDCFNIMMGFVTAKLALSMIPFSPIK